MGQKQPKFKKFSMDTSDIPENKVRAPSATTKNASLNPYEKSRVTGQSPTPFRARQETPTSTIKPVSQTKPSNQFVKPLPFIQNRMPDQPQENKESSNIGFRSRDSATSKVTPHKVFELYESGRYLYTKSILPGFAPFDEKLIRQSDGEYRELDPRRSKLGAAVAKGATNIGIRKNDVVLYLGISHGYTASFVSDMVGKEGIVFGVDPAPRVIRDAIFLSQKRTNIIPLLADANHPEEYIGKICQADIVFQDIAQRNQADIFINNCNIFLKPGGYGLLAVKARSIDIRRKPKDLFNEIRLQLEKIFTVIDFRILEPFEKDHCMIIVKK